MEEIKKTPYEWCLQYNIRPLNLSQWMSEQEFFEGVVSEDTFKEQLKSCDEVKPNSTPRKTRDYLEYRMYGLVPYNLSDKQKCIQYGHAVVEYSEMMYFQSGESMLSDDFWAYRKWASKDKTFIVLDGGTTNLNRNRLGSLNKTLALFRENNITLAEFYEPDLGDQLSGFVFLVDERVFDRKLYPDFAPEPKPYGMNAEQYDYNFSVKNEKNYKKWVEKIGGEKNEFLRQILPTFKLA